MITYLNRLLQGRRRRVADSATTASSVYEPPPSASLTHVSPALAQVVHKLAAEQAVLLQPATTPARSCAAPLAARPTPPPLPAAVQGHGPGWGRLCG